MCNLTIFNAAQYSKMAKSVQNIPQRLPKASLDENRVRVAVRCRPLSEKERNDGHEAIVEFEGTHRIIVHDVGPAPSDLLGTNSGERRNISHVFDFDAVFGYDSKQVDVYVGSCRSVVDGVLQGFNGTIFAYGQTGTGKTYTMEGAGGARLRSNQSSESALKTNKPEDKTSKSSSAIGSDTVAASESEGIIPRSFKHIFEHVAQNKQIQFVIQVSYLEIYQEELHDLLKKDRTVKLELHERPDTGVFVKDLSSVICKSVNDIQRIMRIGNQNRKVGATDMNEHSSRSHAIFMITIEQQSLQSNNRSGSPEEPVVRRGKLNLVDLAGSERQRKTNSLGQRQKESIKINLSLATLGNVINSLTRINTATTKQTNNGAGATQVNGFTPYRDSKLTRLLQDSLGGNSKTLMIANIGPASYNYDETINTLNYASKAKCIRNSPRLNEDPKDALLTELRLEIKELKSKLASLNSNDPQSCKLQKRGSKGSSTDNGYSSSPSSAQSNKRLEGELVELRTKLAGLESKLLNGDQQGNALSKDLLEAYTREQAAELEKSQSQLLDQKSRQTSMLDELERREADELLAKQSYSSIQQELEAKKQLIRQILAKVKAVRVEVESSQSAATLELDDLDQLQFNLQKELKLKCLIMDNFIPNEHVDQLLPRIAYDDKRSACVLAPIELSTEGECNLSPDYYRPFDQVWTPTEPGCLRPRSEFERISEAIDSSDIRFKYTNVIEPKLCVVKHEPMPRLRPELEPPSDMDESELFSSKIQAIIDSSLNQHEPDIVI